MAGASSTTTTTSRRDGSPLWRSTMRTWRKSPSSARRRRDSVSAVSESGSPSAMARCRLIVGRADPGVADHQHVVHQDLRTLVHLENEFGQPGPGWGRSRFDPREPVAAVPVQRENRVAIVADLPFVEGATRLRDNARHAASRHSSRGCRSPSPGRSRSGDRAARRSGRPSAHRPAPAPRESVSSGRTRTSRNPARRNCSAMNAKLGVDLGPARTARRR